MDSIRFARMSEESRCRVRLLEDGLDSDGRFKQWLGGLDYLALLNLLPASTFGPPRTNSEKLAFEELKKRVSAKSIEELKNGRAALSDMEVYAIVFSMEIEIVISVLKDTSADYIYAAAIERSASEFSKHEVQEFVVGELRTGWEKTRRAAHSLVASRADDLEDEMLFEAFLKTSDLRNKKLTRVLEGEIVKRMREVPEERIMNFVGGGCESLAWFALKEFKRRKKVGAKK